MNTAELKFVPVDYRKLNSRQKENYNFLKISAVLADFGFITFRLTDDWLGADFIALHISGDVLRVQLKGRLTFQKGLMGKGLYVAFFDRVGEEWYLYPHDELFDEVSRETNIPNTEAWTKNGLYSIDPLPKGMLERLKRFQIPKVHAPSALSTEDNE
jgi:hypothetical protein